MRKLYSNVLTALHNRVKLRNLNLLSANALRAIAWIAASALLMLSSPARAQSPSPFAVETNIHGVYAYTQPPAGFDPMTASADELKLYGYPPRPAANEPAEAFAQWKMVVNPALKRVVPELLRTNIYHRPVSGLAIQNGKKTATSSNWSGYGLLLKKPDFTSVSGSWIVPVAQDAFGTCSGTPVYASQWVGIDGFSNDHLYQSGSDTAAECSGGTTSTEYIPWIEWLPAAELEIVKSGGGSLPFAPGDYLSVTVTATDWSAGESSNGTLLYTDVTQQWQASFAVTAAELGGDYVTGQSVEWIDERPEVGGSLATLSNYVANPWYDATAKDQKGKNYATGTPGSSTSYNITMLDNGGSPISYVQLFGTNVLWFFDENSAL
jgi:hypothetical protein